MATLDGPPDEEPGRLVLHLLEPLVPAVLDHPGGQEGAQPGGQVEVRCQVEARWCAGGGQVDVRWRPVSRQVEACR